MICLFCINDVVGPKIIIKSTAGNNATICEDCCDIAYAELTARRVRDRNTIKVVNPDDPRQFVLIERISAITADG